MYTELKQVLCLRSCSDHTKFDSRQRCTFICVVLKTYLEKNNAKIFSIIVLIWATWWQKMVLLSCSKKAIGFNLDWNYFVW